MTTPEQLAKLPKHAQETIKNLRRDLDRERQYAIALDLNSDSTILVAPASTNAVRIYSVERFLW